MLVTSPLVIEEAEMRSFSQNYIMSLELEYLFHSGAIASMTQEQRNSIAQDRNFSERELLQKYHDPIVLDVGSGLISSVGTLNSEGHRISLKACDALGVQYMVLTSLYGIKPYVKTDFAFVERLTDKYGTNTFDIVRMRNALDHCYDPFMGVFEMLRAVKMGGTVRLIHSENESEREHAYGLHQWNITSDGEDSMLIWQKNFRADLKDILGRAVKINTTRQQRQNQPCMIISDIVKLEDIEIPAKTGMNILDETMITFCLMKTSPQFASVYKKLYGHDPFRKNFMQRIISHIPSHIREYLPDWLRQSVKKILGKK